MSPSKLPDTATFRDQSRDGDAAHARRRESPPPTLQIPMVDLTLIPRLLSLFLISAIAFADDLLRAQVLPLRHWHWHWWGRPL